MLKVLCGMISSGKSTYANQKAGEGWIIVNDDNVVNCVHNGNYTFYDKSLKPLYKSIEDHILHTSVAMGKNVVIDRAHDLNDKSRARWIALGRALDVPVQAVIFEVFSPEIHARRRTDSDARGYDYSYWLKVAKSHADKYVCPDLQEGFESIEAVKWQSFGG